MKVFYLNWIIFLDALDNLSNNQLSHSVIPPKEMSDLIVHVNEVLKTQYPNYELVVSKVHDYYNLPFSNFCMPGNHPDDTYFLLYQTNQLRISVYV